MIALRGKDAVVIAVENILTSKLHEPRSLHHLHTVDSGIGLVCVSVSVCMRVYVSLSLSMCACV